MRFKHSVNFIILLIIAIVLYPGVSKANTADLEMKIKKISECEAEGKSVDRLLAAVNSGRISENDAVNIIEPILDICEQGYPVKIYLRKMDEGLGKKIPAPIIISALKRMRNNYLSIQEAVSNDYNALGEDMIASATAAADSGVNIDFVTTCITKYKGNRDPAVLTNAFHTARALAETGFNQQQLEKIITAAIDSGNIDASWKYVSRVVAASRSKGISDSALATTAIKILNENKTLVDFMIALGFSERSIN
ncbi:hypothetical protein [Maridesulfovibrio sp.]|uniref:hypothetical protein n=1 Tax=Maridesulfovibrio sp. TaxID=2795000 RepID=UPI0029CA5038|nr:hypothetical protein [Maridesulfovibrio sp.]